MPYFNACGGREESDTLGQRPTSLFIRFPAAMGVLAMSKVVQVGTEGQHW